MARFRAPGELAVVGSNAGARSPPFHRSAVRAVMSRALLRRPGRAPGRGRSTAAAARTRDVLSIQRPRPRSGRRGRAVARRRRCRIGLYARLGGRGRDRRGGREPRPTSSCCCRRPQPCGPSGCRFSTCRPGAAQFVSAVRQASRPGQRSSSRQSPGTTPPPVSRRQAEAALRQVTRRARCVEEAASRRRRAGGRGRPAGAVRSRTSAAPAADGRGRACSRRRRAAARQASCRIGFGPAGALGRSGVLARGLASL